MEKMNDIRFCKRCKGAYDIGIDNELCPECRKGLKKKHCPNCGYKLLDDICNENNKGKKFCSECSKLVIPVKNLKEIENGKCSA